MQTVKAGDITPAKMPKAHPVMQNTWVFEIPGSKRTPITPTHSEPRISVFVQQCTCWRGPSALASGLAEVDLTAWCCTGSACSIVGIMLLLLRSYLLYSVQELLKRSGQSGNRDRGEVSRLVMYSLLVGSMDAVLSRCSRPKFLDSACIKHLRGSCELPCCFIVLSRGSMLLKLHDTFGMLHTHRQNRKMTPRSSCVSSS